MNRVIEHAKHNLLDIMIFAVGAVILGYYIPVIYFRYFDHTAYYSIVSPIEVEKACYKAGDMVTVEITRKALLDLQGVSIRELTLTSLNKEITHEVTNLALNVGSSKIMTDWKLPDNLADGVYYFKGVVSYQVRGINKTTSFYSETFTVKNETTKELQSK